MATIDQETEERVYRLTVRTLYLVALALNAILIYEQVKETPEGKIFRARMTEIRTDLFDRINAAKKFRKQANAVVFEAITIVEEGK